MKIDQFVDTLLRGSFYTDMERNDYNIEVKVNIFNKKVNSFNAIRSQ